MDIPVYISMTSMFRRQDRLFICLKSILNQSYIPNKIYIYLSEDKSFFDDGFKDKKITNESLLTLISENEIYEVKIVTQNFKSKIRNYRKIRCVTTRKIRLFLTSQRNLAKAKYIATCA